MKRLRYVLPILAVIAVVSFLAFKKAERPGVKPTTTFDYFHYSPTVESESAYQNDANWSFLGNDAPEINPCDPGTDVVCVVHVDHALIIGQAGSTLEEKFTNYLASLPESSPGADDRATQYVEDASNEDYLKTNE